ncbi:phosphonate C-P lyase system protein PhnL [Alkalicoccobacillus murimartini]|uniref:Alpha-D-ribose 1-methylphosphonate 5-triphosphate synthase subunit PhnL n=1 Tax=Alkalicoccobacillus murimartini TaxID=171685 RepID=A0ABT9YIC7_9BACI|nr:ATP-binding cassette domain-containing protein [Alkalicoccobacillus murimartini]MDQ0206967.1 alpha-D-ribose 1-methylphosphonate 5-triphosphate synthase subunit PhnL [Alkalicoccobacillus murimartini]
MPLLQVEGFGKSFTIAHLSQTIRAVEGIDFMVEKGAFLGITGKSGSGKSTILKSIYRTYLPDEGRIWFDSEQFGRIDLLQADEQQMVYLRKHEIGYVSQFLSVMPRTTTLQLVEQSVLEMGYSQRDANKEAIHVLTHFELDERLWHTYPNTFSGGEKLRLNIAIASVKKPRLLLLDEPTASLDGKSKLKVRELIEKLKLDGTTLIGVFHDIEFMDGLCDQVYDMKQKAYEQTERVR